MVVLKLSVIYMVIVLSTSTTLSDSYVDDRIVNGFTATPGQFPYQALLRCGGRRCGGSLLNNEWVITAGHCSNGATEIEVTLGAQSYFNVSEPGRLTDTTNIKFLHPSFSCGHGASIEQCDNDLSLVKLSKKIDFTDRIQPIRLPKSDDSFAASAVIVSGWGRIRTNGETPSQLQWASMKTITNNECNKFFKWTMRSTFICAQGNRKESACHGDSGGPLVLQSDNRTLVGVASHLIASNCDSGNPQVYVRIASYRQWIKEVTGIDST